MSAINELSKGDVELFALSAKGSNNGHPHVALDAAHGLWYTWVRNQGKGDEIVVCRRDREIIGEPEVISREPGIHFRPRAVCTADGMVWIVWATRMGLIWRVIARRYYRGEWGPEELIANDDACWPEVAADRSGGLWVAWEYLRGDRHGIAIRRRDASGWSERQELTSGKPFDFRPCLAVEGRNRAWVSGGSFRDGAYSVYLRYREGEAWSDEMEIPGSRNLDRTRARIATDLFGRVWLAYSRMKPMLSYYRWQGRPRDFDRGALHPSIHLIAWEDGEWRAPLAAPELPPTWVARQGNVPVIATRKNKVWVFWQHLRGHMDWIIQGRCYEKGNWTDTIELPYAGRYNEWLSLAADGFARPWIVSDGAALAFEDRMIVARRVATRRRPPMAAAQEWLIPLPDEEVPSQRAVPFAAIAECDWTIKAEGETFHLAWGDLHCQTLLSDGHNGMPDHFYTQGAHQYHYDVAAATDHCDSNKWLRCEFAVLQRTAKAFDTLPDFCAIPGWEYTQGDYGEPQFGHRIILHQSDQHSFVSPLEGDGATPIELNRALRQTDALMSAHHISRVTSGGTSWYLWDQAVEPNVEICSHWGRFEFFQNYEHIISDGNTEVPGCSVQDALAMGHRLGFLGGSDSHELVHTLSPGTTVLLVPELSREAVFDALRHRRCYATTGVKIFVDFRVNGHLMGSEVASANPPQIEARVVGTAPVRELTIVRDNQDIYTLSPKTQRATLSYVDENCAPGSHYYYLRVVQEDGHGAWASPVWVVVGDR